MTDERDVQRLAGPCHPEWWDDETRPHFYILWFFTSTQNMCETQRSNRPEFTVSVISRHFEHTVCWFVVLKCHFALSPKETKKEMPFEDFSFSYCNYE